MGVDKPSPTVTGDNIDDYNSKNDDHSGQNNNDDQAKEDDNPNQAVVENDAFKVITPKPNEVVGNSFILKGKARVFEASFQYRLEDGHNVLAEGVIMADKGAPDWGDFEINVKFEGATSPSAVLVLYEASAKDGSPQHELFIPLKLKNWE